MINDMVAPNELAVIHRVLEEIRNEFPVVEAFEFDEKIRNIVNSKIHDKLAILEDKYEAEANIVLMDMKEAFDDR